MNGRFEGRPVRTTFRAVDHPVATREDLWRQAVQDSFGPMEMRLDDGPDDRDEIVSVRIGDISVTESNAGPGEAWWTSRHVRDSDPDLCQLIVVVKGTVVGEQCGCRTTFAPGDLVLVDLARPRRCIHGTRQAVFVTFPRALLPLPRPARLTGIRMRADRGSAALLFDVVRRLPRHIDGNTGAFAARLGTAVLNLLTVALAAHIDAEPTGASETARNDLRMRIGAFIESHLGDPDLSPSAIADAHHISLRYLHKLFESDGVAGLIRRRRLERCRRDLLDPARADGPVCTIGARWGFTSAAHFSRLFREAYGVPPAEYRATHASLAA